MACIARAFAEQAAPVRMRLSLMRASLDDGALRLWETTLAPPVVVKIECQDLGAALGLGADVTDEQCRLLVESNRSLVTTLAEDLFSQGRVQLGAELIRVVLLGVLEMQSRPFAMGVLDMSVRWGGR